MSGENDGQTTGTDDDASDVADADPVRTLTPWRLGAWTAELLSVPVGLVDAYLPVIGSLDARTREQLIVAVTEVNGSRTAAWVHGAWLEYLGAGHADDDALGPLFDYARACAEAGVPLDTTTLRAVYPPAVVRSLRATVAVAQLHTLVGNTAEQVVTRVRRRRLGSPVQAVHDAVAFGLSVPVALPTVALASAMKVLTRLAPPLPRIELPPAPEANLAVHLLAEATPTYLGHALVRTGLVWSPVSLAVAFRMDGVSATIRAGRGRVAISNGVDSDVVAVVDGSVEPVLQLVAGSILRDLGVPVRRRH